MHVPGGTVEVNDVGFPSINACTPYQKRMGGVTQNLSEVKVIKSEDIRFLTLVHPKCFISISLKTHLLMTNALVSSSHRNLNVL